MVVEKIKRLNEYPSDLVDRLKDEISENMESRNCGTVDIGDNGRAYLEVGAADGSRDKYAIILHEIRGFKNVLRIVLPKGKEKHSSLDYQVRNWMIKKGVTPENVRYDGVCEVGTVMYELLRK